MLTPTTSDGIDDDEALGIIAWRMGKTCDRLSCTKKEKICKRRVHLDSIPQETWKRRTLLLVLWRKRMMITLMPDPHRKRISITRKNERTGDLLMRRCLEVLCQINVGAGAWDSLPSTHAVSLHVIFFYPWVFFYFSSYPSFTSNYILCCSQPERVSIWLPLPLFLQSPCLSILPIHSFGKEQTPSSASSSFLLVSSHHSLHFFLTVCDVFTFAYLPSLFPIFLLLIFHSIHSLLSSSSHVLYSDWLREKWE